MNCHDERISSFLDDAMPATERAAFESELLDNSELCQQVTELRQLRQDVSALPRYSVTEGFAQRVVSAAVAAKADKDAQITLPTRPKHIRRVAIGSLAIAASVAILVGTLAWNNNNDPIANNNNGPQVATENPALVSVFASLPGDGEALVLRIKSPKDVAVGQLLRDALAEQGITRRALGDKKTMAAAVGNAYRKQVGNDKSKQIRAADALYLEISPEELELVLSRIAEPTPALKFIPEHRLAVMEKTQVVDPLNTQKVSAAEKIAGDDQGPNVAGNDSAEFVQELSPGLFRLPKTEGDAEVASTTVPTPSATPKGRVRVLILIENVD